MGGEEALPALDTHRFDRAHGRLSAVLLPDEKIPRISSEFLEISHGESQEVLAEQADLRKRLLNELKKGPRQLSQFEDHHQTGKSADGVDFRKQGLANALSIIHPVHVQALGGKDERYINDEDISLLVLMNSDAWQPWMSLIAPFDDLIVGGAITNRLFGFDYVHEKFLTKEKRKFGTYALPLSIG